MMLALHKEGSTLVRGSQIYLGNNFPELHQTMTEFVGQLKNHELQMIFFTVRMSFVHFRKCVFVIECGGANFTGIPDFLPSEPFWWRYCDSHK